MDYTMLILGWNLLVLIVCWLMWIPIGGYVAYQKGRSSIEGRLFGCLGPFGVLIEALLPIKPAL